MKLSTGKVAFPIEFDNGDKDTIYFNPSDPNLFIRFSDFEDKIRERLKDVEDLELTENGLPKNDELVDSFKRINNIICEELDIAFGNKISDVVFKHCSPFAIVDGEYFIVQFMEALRPEIEKQNKKVVAENQKKIAKHTEKYKK